MGEEGLLSHNCTPTVSTQSPIQLSNGEVPDNMPIYDYLHQQNPELADGFQAHFRDDIVAYDKARNRKTMLALDDNGTPVRVHGNGVITWSYPARL